MRPPAVKQNTPVHLRGVLGFERAKTGQVHRSTGKSSMPLSNNSSISASGKSVYSILCDVEPPNQNALMWWRFGNTFPDQLKRWVDYNGPTRGDIANIEKLEKLGLRGGTRIEIPKVRRPPGSKRRRSLTRHRWMVT